MTENPTQPPPPPPPTDAPPLADHGPRVGADDLRDLGRLRRSSSDRKIAGVAGGLARHLDVDPLLVRVALVVLIFFGGSGLLIYGAGWLLLPMDDGREAPVRLDDRSRTVALVVIGVVAALSLVGGATDGPGLLWPLVVVAAIVGGVLLLKDQGVRLPRRAPSADRTGADGPAAWTEPIPAPVMTPPAPVRPDPRRTGPLLFGFTVALMAVVVGLVGVADLAGAGITPVTYPASALAVVGLMLVVGAFLGRAGGLILVGLLLLPVLAVTAVIESIDGEDVALQPRTAAELPLTHDGDVGSYRLDLTGLEFPLALQGRRITLSEDIGRLEVIVPADVNVIVEATIDGAGQIDVFDRTADGLGPSLSAGALNDPAQALTLDLTVGIGSIEVTRS